MYTLIETSGRTQVTPAPYASLSEGTEALIERAFVLARRPGTKIVAQQPRRVVLADAGGTRTTIHIRHIPVT